jgi:hypothetical protein
MQGIVILLSSMGVDPMAKQNRGKGLWGKPGRGKGTCPLCARTSTKLLWQTKDEQGNDVQVCKRCKNH